MRYGSYSAKSFNIPFHDYSGYSGVDACQSSVADAFFQTGDSSDADVPDDFPVIVYSTAGASLEAPSGTGNNTGCDLFVAQQERLKTQVAENTGYALDESGNLVVFAPTEAAFTEGRTATDLSYVYWGSKGNEFNWVGSYGETTDSRYLARVDGVNNLLRISPLSAASSIDVPSGTSITASQGKFGTSWHGRRGETRNTIRGNYIYRNGVYVCDGRLDPDQVTCRDSFAPQWLPSALRVVGKSDIRVASSASANHLSKAKSDRLCPSGYHPRGEDSVYRLGSGTGRTLSGLSQANALVADRFWCRSDVRYQRSFKPQTHTLPTGIVPFLNAPTDVFTAYGRLGCYYTTTGTTTLSNGGYRCVYRFPLPRCDSTGDGTADREYTADEIAVLIARSGNGATVGQQFTIDETADCSPIYAPTPPSQAGFLDVACVTAHLEIYENRVATSGAEPGVVETDRTLTVVAITRDAWDLDITCLLYTSPSPRD